MTDWQQFEVIPEETKDRINRIVKQINDTTPAASSHLLLKSEIRLVIAMGATLALILAVAGSVGEAAYQLRQAELAATSPKVDKPPVPRRKTIPRRNKPFRKRWLNRRRS
jgi:hypothetical protein